jgi:hypothetical protein
VFVRCGEKIVVVWRLVLFPPAPEPLSIVTHVPLIITRSPAPSKTSKTSAKSFG